MSFKKPILFNTSTRYVDNFPTSTYQFVVDGELDPKQYDLAGALEVYPKKKFKWIYNTTFLS